MFNPYLISFLNLIKDNPDLEIKFFAVNENGEFDFSDGDFPEMRICKVYVGDYTIFNGFTFLTEEDAIDAMTSAMQLGKKDINLRWRPAIIVYLAYDE